MVPYGDVEYVAAVYGVVVILDFQFQLVVEHRRSFRLCHLFLEQFGGDGVNVNHLFQVCRLIVVAGFPAGAARGYMGAGNHGATAKAKYQYQCD